MTDEEKLVCALTALKNIAYPIDYLRREAKKEGKELDGYMALKLAQDGNWLSDIAADALIEIAREKEKENDK